MRFGLLALFALLALADARTSEEKEAMNKAIRMKTSRQLKEIFDELSIDYAGLDKEAMRKLAYKEDAVGRWEELHPEKKRKPPKGDGGAGIPGMGGGFGKAPDGMDQGKWDDMMAQMRGDFTGEKDPERRMLLEKLSKRGMSFGGGSNMDTEQLRNLAKVLDDMPDMGAGRSGGMPEMGDKTDAPRFASSMDDDIEEEDKMEL